MIKPKILVTTSNSPTVQEWFALGRRATYDYRAKRILPPDDTEGSQDTVRVFQQVVRDESSGDEAAWITFLPGFPDGSFGWAKVDRHLTDDGRGSKLFVEYVGQGDSDKPSDYRYSTMERADLVEATWEVEGIKSTFVVTFDYSSLVLLELLSRQSERIDGGANPSTKIQGVLLINGGLFADAHSHPWSTTPTLKSPMGAMITRVGQHSRFALKRLLKPLFSKEYGVTSEELDEIAEAISRRDGVAFLHKAAGFVDEHQVNAERWDLRRLFLAFQDNVSFHVVGSEGDPFEPNQVVKAQDRLGDYGLDIRLLPGGHMTTSEHPDLIAQIIRELATPLTLASR